MAQCFRTLVALGENLPGFDSQHPHDGSQPSIMPVDAPSLWGPTGRNQSLITWPGLPSWLSSFCWFPLNSVN